MKLEKGNPVSCELIPYIQCHEKPIIRKMNDGERKKFDQELLSINKTISDDKSLCHLYEKYLENSAESVKELFLPIVNRISVALLRRRLLPFFIPEGKKNRVLDYIVCESHLPKVIYYLKNKKNE